MNSRQKVVQERFLHDEQAVLKRLDKVYGQSLKDIKQVIAQHYDSIKSLTEQLNELDPNDPKRAILQSRIRSKVYQKNYQEQLQNQVSGILNNLKTKQYTSVSQYLDDCYTDGFIGAVYDLHGQDCPVITPINQQAVARAVQLESKISKGLYTKLGEDIDLLRKKITAQVSRSLVTGTSFAQCAKQIADYTSIGYNNSVRIARTEGHRVQVSATMDAISDAKERGADVVKQWDATLDGRTRKSHARCDGEIREIDQKFSNGLMYPGDPAGGAGEVVNCRCALLQRAKWALDDKELQTLKDRAQQHGLDKTADFDDFKTKYLKATAEAETPAPAKSKFKPATTVQDLLSFTKEQKEAIEYYVGGDGMWINQHMRGRMGGQLSPFEQDFLKQLKSATDRPLPADIHTLYRAVDARAIFGDGFSMDDWEDLNTALKYNTGLTASRKQWVQSLLSRTNGKTIVEKGFMSTSKSYDLVVDWGDFTGSDMSLVLEFDNIPKGIKGADLKAFDVEGNEQLEVLLAPNTEYEVESITAKDGNIFVKAKLKNKK